MRSDPYGRTLYDAMRARGLGSYREKLVMGG
jgi:hypothetical protein